MEKLIVSLMVIGSFTVASAQVDIENEDVQDKIQQEPPREQQRTVERTAANAEVNSQNNKAVRDGEAKLEKEIEKATGKESKNPAETNPATVRQPQTIDPPKTNN